MPFMIPEYERSAFIIATNRNGESFTVLADDYDSDEASRWDIVKTEQVNGWFARLSAPDYLEECTDWGGPFATLKDAQEHIVNQFGVDPNTGDMLYEEVP